MARMHSASKGRSGAATPQEKTSPSKLSTKEVEQIVIKLNKAGKTTSTTQDDKGGKYTNEEPLQYWYETCMKEKGLMSLFLLLTKIF